VRARSYRTVLTAGLVGGVAFGCVDLVLTWLNPTEDDSPLVLLRFYGPMFLFWGVVAFRRARRGGGLSSGIVAGILVALATFSVFVAINFARVNIFLYQLTAREDWDGLMMRFRASGAADLRTFVNGDYLREIPGKMFAATVFGTACGVIGGISGWFLRRRNGQSEIAQP